MKEDNNEPAARPIPTEAEMNDMHRNAWLDYHADVQADKQALNRAYAITVNKYGSYKNIPYEVKELLKKNYESHEAKWGENGTEMQKRFGEKEPDPTVKPAGTTEQKHPEDQTEKRQAFLQNIKEHRQAQESRKAEYEPS